MSQWPAAKARRVLAALCVLAVLARPDWPDVVFAFHDDDEIGPRMLARIAKRTGLQPSDL